MSLDALSHNFNKIRTGRHLVAVEAAEPGILSDQNSALFGGELGRERGFPSGDLAAQHVQRRGSGRHDETTF